MFDSKDENSAYTVSQVTKLIKQMLELNFSAITIKGEISNYRPNSSGHLYFVLKDDESQINAVMFRFRANTLDFEPKDGTLVQVWGSINVYEPRGTYQIVITKMEKAGTGDIMEMIERRKKRLAEEGLFDFNRKKALPYLPKTVGIVTSPTGAALRDILQIAERRNDKVNIIIFPSLVQGAEASENITRMIEIANKFQMCDVLIVGRGGGSIEDLLPFSEENVVRAIANSSIPVISAVGHDTDYSLSDFASDVRAPTPSAAAELAIPLKQDILLRINQNKNELYQNIQNRLENLKLLVKSFKPENMELQLRRIETPLLMRLSQSKENLISNLDEIIKEKKLKIKEYKQTLDICNPQNIFNRGYSMVCDINGNVIRNVNQVKINDKIIVKTAKGKLISAVEKIEQ